MTTRPRASRGCRASERGAALIFTLVALAMVTLMGLAISGLGMASVTMSTLEDETREALAVADAGIEHGRKLLLWPELQSMTAFLQNVDANGCSWDEFSAPPAVPLPTAYPTDATHFIPAAGRPFGRGTYFVTLCDNHTVESGLPTPDVDPSTDVDGRVLLRSVGVLASGARAGIEMLIAAQPLPAIIVNGHLRLSGNPNVTGPAGAVHANGTLELSGNPCTHEYYSSSGQVLPLSGGNAQGGAACTTTARDIRPYEPPLNVPVLRPVDYAAFATYHLTATGEIRAGYNGMVTTVPGWNFQSNHQVWKWTSGEPPPGTYYVDGNVEINGGGSVATPLAITLLVEGSWVQGGNPTLTAHQTLPMLGPVQVIAGRDISLGSSFNSTGEGLYYARQQLEVAGGPTINGQLIAANHCEVGNWGAADCRDLGFPTSHTNPNQNPVTLDSSGRMTISGNPTVNYSGNGAQSFQSVHWRECRGVWAGVGPGSPCGEP
jgi:hypothetical protein